MKRNKLHCDSVSLLIFFDALSVGNFCFTKLKYYVRKGYRYSTPLHSL